MGLVGTTLGCGAAGRPAAGVLSTSERTRKNKTWEALRTAQSATTVPHAPAILVFLASATHVQATLPSPACGTPHSGHNGLHS